MKRKNTEEVQHVLRRFMKAYNIERPYMEHRTMNEWADIMGEQIAAQTKNLYFKQSTLFIQVNSSVLRHELFLKREAIKDQINEHLSYSVVKNIMVQ